MFYLMTHSTHFYYGFMASDIIIWHLVKDQIDRERKPATASTWVNSFD